MNDIKSIIEKIFRVKERAEAVKDAERLKREQIQKDIVSDAIKAAGLAKKKSEADIKVDVEKRNLLEPELDRSLEINAKDKKNITKEDKDFLTNEKRKKEIRESNLSQENKELLAYSLKESARDIPKKGTTEAIKLLEFVERKYGKSILNLNELLFYQWYLIFYFPLLFFKPFIFIIWEN